MDFLKKISVLFAAWLTIGCFAMPPLHRAVAEGNLARVKELITAGDNINAHAPQKVFFSKTPLHYAAEFAHVEIVKILIASGANVNEPDCNGDTPLHYAATNGNLDIVQILIFAGARITMFQILGASRCRYSAIARCMGQAQYIQSRAPMIRHQLALATHPRLGGHNTTPPESLLSMLPQHLLRYIADLTTLIELRDVFQPPV